MMLATITVDVMSEAGGQSDEEMLNTSLQSLPSHEASEMITDDPHILPVLGCPTENMKVCRSNPPQCFRVDPP